MSKLIWGLVSIAGLELLLCFGIHIAALAELNIPVIAVQIMTYGVLGAILAVSLTMKLFWSEFIHNEDNSDLLKDISQFTSYWMGLLLGLVIPYALITRAKAPDLIWEDKIIPAVAARESAYCSIFYALAFVLLTIAAKITREDEYGEVLEREPMKWQGKWEE